MTPNNIIYVERQYISKNEYDTLFQINQEIKDRIKQLENKLLLLENNINNQNKIIFNLLSHFSSKS